MGSIDEEVLVGRNLKLVALILPIYLFSISALARKIVSKPVVVSVKASLPPGSSELAKLAATMQSGTWAQLIVLNQDSVMGVGNNDGSMITYSNSMPWNPVNKTIEIIARDHHYTSSFGLDAANRYVRYEVSTNQFVFVADLPEIKDGHGGDTLTLNPTTGDLYWRMYTGFTGRISAKKKALGASNFSDIPSVDGLEQVAIGTTWWSGPFVGGGRQGSFMIFNSGNSTGGATDGQIVAYNPLTNSWFYNQQGKAPFYGSGSTYNSVIEYSPQKNVAVYGGGNVAPTKLWRMDSNGNAVAMPDTPPGTSVGLQKGNLVNDPATGNFLLLSNRQLWELNPDGAGKWTRKMDPPALVGNPSLPENMISAAISDYGVVAYITQRNQAGGNFFLYKP